MSRSHSTAVSRRPATAPPPALAATRTRRRRGLASLVAVAGMTLVAAAAPTAGSVWAQAQTSLDQSRHVQQFIDRAHAHALDVRGSASLEVEDLTWSAAHSPQRWVVSPATSRALWAEPIGDCVVLNLVDVDGYVTAQISVLATQYCPGR